MTRTEASSIPEHEGESTSNAVVTEARGGRPKANLRWGAAAIGVAGVMIIAYGGAFLYRAFFGDGFELGVDTLGGVARADLATTNPELLAYIDYLHVNIAGLMVALGIAVLALAWFGVRERHRWALTTAVTLPTVFVGFSLPLHFTGGFDYHALVHIGPAGLGAPVLLVGAVLAYRGIEATDRLDSRRSHQE